MTLGLSLAENLMRKQPFSPLDPYEARPIVKWAGGKAALVPDLLAEMPKKIGTYIEPFAGGAALFFALASTAKPRFQRAQLNDKNEELVACYRAVRDHLDAMVTRLGSYHYDKDLYYSVRDVETKELTDPARGARLLFLNRTCFNGLWRENSKGKNNVPFGTYDDPKILDLPTLERAHRALAWVRLTSVDFEVACEGLVRGDFAYFDPPYVPLSKTASFTAYSAAGFSRKDQERLVVLLRTLKARGVHAMLSNADSPKTRELYSEFRMKKVQARRSINSDKSKRGVTGELVVMNYEEGKRP